MTGVDHTQLAWLLGIDAASFAGGLGLLVAVGFVRSRSELVARGGVALLVGMLLGAIAEAHVALIGVPLSIVTLGVVDGLLVLAGVRAWRRSERPPDPPLPRRASALIAPAALGIAAVQLAHIAATAAVRPMLEWDSWAIWGFKARELAVYGSADPSVFANRAYLLSHLDYPILQPALEAQTLRGSWDPGIAHLQVVVLIAAALWAIVGLCHGRIPLELPSLAVLFLVTQSWFVEGTLSGFADIPVAVVSACALVALLRFSLDGDRRVLALGAICAGGAGLLKNEGSLFVLAAFAAVAVAVLVARRPRDLRPLGVALAGTVALWLPWRLYVALHGLPSNDYSLGTALHPSFLRAQWGRVDPSVSALWTQLEPHDLRTPGALLAIGLIAALLTRRFALALALAIWCTLAFAGLVVIYWISIVGLDWQISTSANRVTNSLLVGGVVAGAFGAGEALRNHVLSSVGGPSDAPPPAVDDTSAGDSPPAEVAESLERAGA